MLLLSLNQCVLQGIVQWYLLYTVFFKQNIRNSWLFSEVYLAWFHYITCVEVVLYVFMYMWQKIYWHCAAVFCWGAGSSVDVQWQTKVNTVLFLHLCFCERSINSLR